MTTGVLGGWHPHLEVWALMSALGVGYLVILKKLGPEHSSPGERPVSRRQVVSFLFGLASAWVAADWPIHELSERYLFSVHMVQHMVFSFITAPLLLMGTPGWLIRLILRPKPVMAAARVLTKPVPAMLVFNAFLVFSHWPVFVEWTLASEWGHFGAHLTLVSVSLIMWWPVLSPIAELPRISRPAQLLYLFLQTIVPTVPASFLTFSETPFYATYEAAPRLFGISAIGDQRAAGLIMKLGGGLYLWSVIAILFFRWSESEEGLVPDASELQELERRVNVPGEPR